MIVRRATPDDMPWLLAESMAFALTVPTARPLFGSDSHAEALMGTLIRDQFVAVAERDGRPVGLIAGICAAHPFNPDYVVASELLWWVVPEARGTRAGHLLLGAFDAWADSTSADDVQMTTEADSPLTARVLAKRGYRVAEVQYLRRGSASTVTT